MIRPLRRQHRVMVLSLTITLPAAFAMGIASRKQVPASPAGALGPSMEARNWTVLWTRHDLWEKRAIQTRLLTLGPVPGQLAIELTPTDHIIRPDLLVYWVPGERKFQDTLPDDAFLLGSFAQSSPTPLALHDAASKQIGALVLYGLADQEIIAVSKSFSTQ